jgi:hydroxymethylpyrimidine/phosphomethylpyrimidine kinase
MTARILIIAGSDSGGGAGIQADIKTVTMLGGHAMTAITAVTAQNTLGVQAIVPMPADLIAAQIESVATDIGVDAVKIGMIANAESIRMIGSMLVMLRDALQEGRSGKGIFPVPVVVDPVMVSTSGDKLIDDDAIQTMFTHLFPFATVITPNLPEFERLGGDSVLATMKAPVLIKGGHGTGATIVDRLVSREGELARWEDRRIDSMSTHGTGCTLSSAIAIGLGQGLSLTDAINRARLFVRAAILAAPGFGSGNGPMGHQAVKSQ